MLKVILIGGEPATGKTTLMWELIAQLPGERTPFCYQKVKGYFWGRVFVLGVYWRGKTFSGTDTLSMGVQPDAVKFLEHLRLEPEDAIVLAEGDRLFTHSFIAACQRLAHEMRLFVLEADADLKQVRHEQRGDQQSESWRRGRRTKIERICQAYPVTLLRHDTKQDTDAAVRVISAELFSSSNPPPAHE
jgi:hypothetical protein